MTFIAIVDLGSISVLLEGCADMPSRDVTRSTSCCFDTEVNVVGIHAFGTGG